MSVETLMSIMRALLLIVLSAAALAAQTPAIQTNGTASINVTPDQASLTAGVVTQGATAQEAGQQNATQTTAMLNALKTALGVNGTVQTVGYSVSPRYNNASPAAIVGYTASNTVQVVTTNLAIIGSLIDTANQAGANNISGVSFGLQDPEPVMQQALGKAARQALNHAAAIAAGMGAKTGAILSAQEGATYSPVTVNGLGAPTTPIQTGTVTVTATVTANVQLLQ